ncbi:MAG: Leucyl-tRNA synthetase, mitochondrial [Chaenotheca gracillima]|nr:MAG: Leucyl-tRNA synthetase, mitochondrial [Chaenotheca gracillima]
MQGHEVVHPMGWDAFGLPAENAAIERGIDPQTWTTQNIAKMKEQLVAMGGRWDWDRELTTCDPQFYKHTQHIFLLLHQHGLAYQADSLVNYDPIDRTVLANEQVDANGFSWRSGAKVEKRRLKQWFLRITDFKEDLLNDLEILSRENGWPERVLAMQRNWLGKSQGATIKFPIIGGEGGSQETLDTFTTRPDTLFGVQYVALSIRHPVVVRLARSSPILQQFIDKAADLPPDSKVGYLLPDVSAQNPIAFLDNVPSASKENLPIYVAPYVLDDYGEGAVMGVPGHDSRDYAFWKANRGEEAIRAVVGPTESPPKSPTEAASLFTGQGILMENCGSFAGKASAAATSEIVQSLKEAGNHASETETWRLRDWLISRQRYWGTPIPMVHCQTCGAVPVPESELPVELPKLEGSQFRGKGNPLEEAEEWVNTKCPRCGGNAKRDTDTMDTFVDSSWYFMRFADPKNTSAPFTPEAADALLPVDIYVGGVEHAILHLLYARFLTKFLSRISLWPAGRAANTRGEPFRKLITQGMVHGKTYSDPTTGRFLRPEEIEFSSKGSPTVKATGDVASISFEKMSKSKHNGVDPGTCIAKYGADVTRAHMLFQAPVGEILEWDEVKIVGIQRWLARMWRLVLDVPRAVETPLPPVSNFSATDLSIWTQVEGTIQSVTTSLSTTYSLNTVISDLTKLTNSLSATVQGGPPDSLEAKPKNVILFHAVSALVRLVAPVTPAFAEECWEVLHTEAGLSGSPKWQQANASIFETPFPTASNAELPDLQPTQTCAVQINGKLRFTIDVPRLSSDLPNKLVYDPRRQNSDDVETHKTIEALINAVLATEEGKHWLGSEPLARVQAAKKIIVVRGGRVVNFVL